MFDSSKTSILWEKNGPLAIMWMAANLGTTRITGLKVVLSKREYARADVIEACALILSPKETLHLRLCAHLLVGIVRVHNKQAHYVLMDMNDLRRRFELLHSLSVGDRVTARFDAITLPESDFNSSLSIIQDSYSFLPFLSHSKAGYINMDVYPMETPDLPCSETVPMNGGPTVEDDHTVTDLKNISIEDHILESPNSTLNDSLMESMYFGDEDPQLLASDQQQTGGDEHQNNEQDEVLLFNDETNDFSFCNGSNEVSVSSAGSDKDHNEEQCEFIINPLTSPLDLTSLGKSLSNKKKKRQYRDELRKGLILDEEIGLSPHEMKLGTKDIKSSTRELKSTKLKLPVPLKAEQLLFRQFTEENTFTEVFSTLSMKLSRQLIIKIGQNSQINTITTGQAKDVFNTPQSSPIGRMLLESEMSHKDSEFTGSNLEVEMMRNGMIDDEMSYEDPLRNASALSGDSTTTIRSGQSFQISTAQRLKLDNDRDPPPPTMGGLSPILDVDEEIDLSGNFALPDLEDSYGSFCESLTDHQSFRATSTSPFIESEPHTYRRHIASVMENRVQVSFKELLPKGSSRKTASKAFSHILVLLSTTKVLEVEQATLYGPIILKRGKDF